MSSSPQRILVADDDSDTRRTLLRVLERLGYETEEAKDGIEALEKLALDVDLVLVDGSMPGLDGFEVTSRIRADDALLDLPVIMLTGLDTRDDRIRAIEAGVNDFLTKPCDVNELRLRCRWLLRMKEATDEVKRQRAELERRVEQRTKHLRKALEDAAAGQRRTQEAHLDTIRRLVLAAEFKDRDTAAHIERIGRMSAALGSALGMSPREVDVLRYAAQMHDVGKIGVPDEILLKPGPLTGAEWKVMKGHTTVGARILAGSPSDVLSLGEQVALSHHERWDGTGYPRGLSGEEIPLEGRICAVADVFDALTSNRHYRDAMPAEAVLEMMEASRAKHFDPEILDAFLGLRDEVEEIQRYHAEGRAERAGAPEPFQPWSGMTEGSPDVSSDPSPPPDPGEG